MKIINNILTLLLIPLASFAMETLDPLAKLEIINQTPLTLDNTLFMIKLFGSINYAKDIATSARITSYENAEQKLLQSLLINVVLLMNNHHPIFPTLIEQPNLMTFGKKLNRFLMANYFANGGIKPIWTIQAHCKAITSLKFANYHTLFSGSLDGTLHKLCMQASRKDSPIRSTMKNTGIISAIAPISNDKVFTLSSLNPRQLHFLDMSDNSHGGTLFAHSGGKLLDLSGLGNGWVAIDDKGWAEGIFTLNPPTQGNFQITEQPLTKILAAEYSRFWVWSLPDLTLYKVTIDNNQSDTQEIILPKKFSPVTCAAFAPPNSLFVGDAAGQAHMINVDNWHIQSFPIHHKGINHIAAIDHKTFITSFLDGTLKMFERNQGELTPLLTIKPKKGQITALTSHGGDEGWGDTTVAVGFEDGTLQAYNLHLNDIMHRDLQRLAQEEVRAAHARQVLYEEPYGTFFENIPSELAEEIIEYRKEASE